LTGTHALRAGSGLEKAEACLDLLHTQVNDNEIVVVGSLI
jgi:hypothetical protein